ncbi:protein of unknown function [Paraburkholderia dioscoreae]|uniref:Uncharacterized protein n=1 Tax=Paraburkholderia dioscoreae TaxID=2604047 RepID=A0A5Q4ZDI3_9BURK|nr:protein of unknown function [Paraburkholderia dioscoreae]
MSEQRARVPSFLTDPEAAPTLAALLVPACAFRRRTQLNGKQGAPFARTRQPALPPQR